MKQAEKIKHYQQVVQTFLNLFFDTPGPQIPVVLTVSGLPGYCERKLDAFRQQILPEGRVKECDEMLDALSVVVSSQASSKIAYCEKLVTETEKVRGQLASMLGELMLDDSHRGLIDGIRKIHEDKQGINDANVPVVPPGSPPSPPPTYESREMQQLVEQAKAIFRVQPYHIPTCLLLADHAVKQQRYAQARDFCQRVLKQEPNNEEALRGIAISFYKEKQYQEAIPVYLKVLQLNANDGNACMGIADSYYALEMYKEAAKSYEQGLVTKPNYLHGLVHLGLAYYRLDNYAKAKGPLTQAFGIDDSIDGVAYALAFIHYNEKAFQQSIQLCQHLIKINPNHIPARTGMARCYLELKEFEKVLEFCQQVFELDPNNQAAVQLHVQAKQGLEQQCIEEFKKSGMDDQSRAEILSMLGGFTARDPKAAPNFTLLKEALLLNPNNIDALTAMAQNYLKLKQFEQAKNFADRALLVNPQHVAALMCRAHTHFELKEFHHAEAYYQKVLAIEPKNMEAMENYWRAQGEIKIHDGIADGSLPLVHEEKIGETRVRVFGSGIGK